jgi:site-specific recombinase XerD
MTATREAEVGTLSFEEAVAMFLEYLKGYRSCAAISVKAYRRDLLAFSEFLSQRLGQLPSPDQITRQQVMQFAVSLSDLV